MNGSFISIMGYALAIFIGVVVLFAIYIILFPGKSHKPEPMSHGTAQQLRKRSHK